MTPDLDREVTFFSPATGPLADHLPIKLRNVLDAYEGKRRSLQSIVDAIASVLDIPSDAPSPAGRPRIVIRAPNGEGADWVDFGYIRHEAPGLDGEHTILIRYREAHGRILLPGQLR